MGVSHGRGEGCHSVEVVVGMTDELADPLLELIDSRDDDPGGAGRHPFASIEPLDPQGGQVNLVTRGGRGEREDRRIAPLGPDVNVVLAPRTILSR